MRARFSLFLCIFLAAMFAAGCHLFFSFKDCERNTDCPEAERCNLQRRFCEAPTYEACNGEDDDRDGIADRDEDFGVCAVPSRGTGMCRDGRYRCRNNQTLECVPRAEPAAEETCSNGIDDDCDGAVDNGPNCTANLTASSNLVIGSNNPDDGEGDNAPEHSVCLSAFTIDRHEVTIQAYAVFLSSLDPTKVRIGRPVRPQNPTVPYPRYLLLDEPSGEVPLLVWPSAPTRWSIDRTPSGYVPHHDDVRNTPVVNVTWFGADRYCRWAGKHLPSEAEFLRATRGADGRRPFPWGMESPTCDRANIGRGGPDGGPCVGEPLTVGALPGGATVDGIFELYGNVNEWMWDFLDTDLNHTRNNYYASLPTNARAWCERYPLGPLGPETGSAIAQPEDAGLYCVQCRMARGRHYRTLDLRVGIRRWLDADRADPYLGFRCSQGGAPR